LHGGPWLVKRVFWVFTAIILGGVALLVGTPFVGIVLLKQQFASCWGVLLLLVGAGMIFGGLAWGCVAWLANRFTQICPECLQGMNRGAYVCPWCGFRETPRTEEHP
jgi:hypothetical protein